MIVAILRRGGHALGVIFLVTFAAVALLNLAPGSAGAVILGEGATPESVAALDAKLGLDQPIWVQYANWIAQAVQGNLGVSPVTNVSVTEAILVRLPVTLELALLALVMALFISMFLALLAASFEGGRVDRFIQGLSSALLSIPAFIAGPLLIYFLGLQLHLFPVSGWVHIQDDLAGNLRAAFLPALAIAFTEIGVFQRLLRSDLLGTLREDFIAAAEAKGMPRAYVLWRHALRPSSFSLLTVAGITLGRLIGGTVVVEFLFGLPGIGSLVASSIVMRDIVTVQGVVAFTAVSYVVINMLVDVGYGFLDPRVRKTVNA